MSIGKKLRNGNKRFIELLDFYFKSSEKICLIKLISVIIGNINNNGGECMKKIFYELFYGKYKEIVRYIIVGGFTTLFNLIVFTTSCKFLKIDVNVSNIISIILSIIFAYITNKIFVFESHTHSLKELYLECSKFISARFLTMIIEVGGVFILYNIIGQDELVAKLETQVIVLIGNYLISKFFVFKD